MKRGKCQDFEAQNFGKIMYCKDEKRYFWINKTSCTTSLLLFLQGLNCSINKDKLNVEKASAFLYAFAAAGGTDVMFFEPLKEMGLNRVFIRKNNME